MNIFESFFNKIHNIKYNTKVTLFLFITLVLLILLLFSNSFNYSRLNNIKVDIVYKYIDVRDKELNREGLEQREKDYDNNELKYSLRSVVKNIPWINRIFIIMPNSKISFIDKKKDDGSRIINIKDDSLIGFNSSSSITFEHNGLYKLDRYNISEYFIYLCDDYFINKKLNINDFYYYSKVERRIVPYVMNNNVILSNNTYKYYYNYYKKNKHKLEEECKQTYKDYWFQTCLAYLFLYKHFNSTSILLPLSFDDNWHNALPLTLTDLKELHKVEEKEYEYKDELFNSRYRTNKQITFESVYFYYFFNKYNRKRGKLKGKNINVKNIINGKTKKEISTVLDVFCINTGPERIKRKYIAKEKELMEELFSLPNNFEVIN